MVTIETVWSTATGTDVGDTCLEWPPDVFALTDVVLDRTGAYRFAVSPPAGQRWPATRIPDWTQVVGAAAAQWCAWVERRAEDSTATLPDLVLREWALLREGAATALDDVANGTAWPVCEALLTLHAIADEACAGMGVAVRMPAPDGHRARGWARELLARTGSLSRFARDHLRVLPKVLTPDGGISSRSISRYACVRASNVDVVWHKVPARRPGTAQQHANILLLPWPLRIRQRDFQPVPGSVQRTELEPFGFFEYSPSEPFDFGLLEGLLTAARDEVDNVDVVLLPESALLPEQIAPLEERLAQHDVTILAAGVREKLASPDGPRRSNWVHIGVSLGGRWWHYRQNKHHRWFLNQRQIDQYHLGGALHPSVRWWEAADVPRRAVQLIELGEGITIAAVICEDLARLDEVSDLLRTVGPTLVIAVLLDGPQIPSRWAARYASVLADDPGSTVLTLTAFGFSQRCRPEGRTPSPVVALWKDPEFGFREIALESGSQGVLLSASVSRTRRRSADGRMPVDNTADLLVAGIHQVRATAVAAGDPESSPENPAAPFETVDLTILSSWAQAVAEAAASSSSDAVQRVIDDARTGAAWRAVFGVEQPSTPLAAALDALGAHAKGAAVSGEDAVTELAGILLASARESVGVR